MESLIKQLFNKKPVENTELEDDILKPFYSNCLFEAIKAKIKDPKNVKIHYLEKRITGSTHFYWYNLSNTPKRGMYDFTHKTKLKQKILFKGCINFNSFNMWESFLFNAMKKRGLTKEEQIAYAKKHGFVHKEPFKWDRLPENYFE